VRAAIALTQFEPHYRGFESGEQPIKRVA